MAEGKIPIIAARMRVKGTEEVSRSFDDIRKKGEATFGSLRKTAEAMGDAASQTVDVAVNVGKAAVTTATVSVSAISKTLQGIAGVATFVVDAVLGIATAVAKGALLVAGAAVGAYAATRHFALGIAEGNDEVSRQAQAIGMSVESLSRWQAAIRIAGGDAKAITSAFESVRTKMIEVAKGTAGADKAFRQLNIQVRDGEGKLKDSEALFSEVVENLAKIQDEGVRSAAAFDLFGGAATSILPALRRGTAGLKELQEQSDRYGTSLTTAGAAETAKLLERKRKFDEALKGLGNRFSDAFLPIFVKSADAMATWLDANSKTISEWLEKAGDNFETFVNDVISLFGDGAKAPNLKNSWLAQFYQPAQELRNVVLDLLDAMGGKGLGNRSTWFKDFADTLGEAWNVAKSLVGVLGGILGTDAKDFQLAKSFQDATAAMQSFQAGLAGQTGDVEWATNIGTAVTEAARAIEAVAGTVNDNKDAITSFIIDIAHAAADFSESWRSIFNGQDVGADNMFAWLPPVVAQVVALFEQVKTVGAEVWSEIERNWDTLVSVGNSIISVMDGIAKAMGLGDWKTLGIILVIGQMTGALRLIGSLSTIAAGAMVVLSNAASLVATAWPVIAAIGAQVGAFLAPIVAAIAAFLGIPAAAVIAIAAAIAGIIALLIIFQGDIGKVFGFIWDVIKWPFERLWDLIKLIFGGLGGVAGAAIDGLKGLFAPLGAFFQGILDGIGKIWDDAWGAVGAGAQAAWDGITGLFSGIADFFADPLKRVGDMFGNMWDGIKRGAANAWESVKSFFGFGGEQQQGGSGPSYDVGTDRVPGPDGRPMRATIHGGERILTVAENKKFGAIIDSLLDMTTLPQTPFAVGPTAIPAGAGAGGGGGMMRADFNLNGRTSTLQGAPSAVRSLQSGMRRHQRMAPISPRWIK